MVGGGTHPLLLAGAGVGAYAAVLALAGRAPRVLERRSRAAVRALAGAALVGGALGPQRPTALVPVDAALGAALALTCVYAASGARRRSWLLAGALVALGSPAAPWDLAAFAALALASASATVPYRGRVVGALVGAVVGQAALRLTWPAPLGATALAAAVAVSVLVASWLRTARSSSRRRARRGLAGAAAGLGLALVAGAVSGLAARGPLERGARAAEVGLAAARRGDPAAAALALARAEGQLATAGRRLDAWPARAAWVVPVAGRYARGAAEMAGAAAAVAGPAAVAARLSSSGELRGRGGRFDPAAAARLVEPVEATVAAAERMRASLARLRSPWLVQGVGDRLDRVDRDLARAVEDGRTAAAAARVAPGLLGGRGARRYFVAMQTTSEQRAMGGMIGNWAELTAVDGRLRLVRTGRIGELMDAGVTRRLHPSLRRTVARFDGFGPEAYLQNATLVPDFSTVARILEDLVPQSGGPAVDGVIGVDPTALAALLRLTGPVQVPGWPVPVDAANAERVLLFEQYARLDGQVREAFLGQVVGAVFARLEATDLPGPAALGAVLAPAVRGKHLLVHSARPGEQRLLERLDLSGRMAPARGRDFLQVVSHNTGENKVDWFLRREIDYTASFDPASGATRSELAVRLRNDAPPVGLPPYVIGGPPLTRPGESWMWLNVYSPLRLRSGTVDGRPVPFRSDRELGRWVHSAFLRIPPQATAVVRLELAGALAPALAYRLTVGHQPHVAPDRLSLRLLDGRGRVAWARSAPQDGDVGVVVRAARGVQPKSSPGRESDDMLIGRKSENKARLP